MPRLIVMMPAFNAADTIALAMQSTLRAMPRDSKLVILDDASSDRTAEVAGRAADQRVEIIRSSTRLGGGLARTQILSSTDSEFVASMDADDYCLPWRFSTQLREMRTSDVVFGSTVRFSTNPFRLLPSAALPLRAQKLLVSLLVGSYLPHPTLLAARSVIEAAGGYRDIKRGQDYDLWLRFAARGVAMRKLATPVVGYRLSDSQVSSSDDYLTTLQSDEHLRGSYRRFVASAFPALAPFLHFDLTSEAQSARWDMLVKEQAEAVGGVVGAYLSKRIARNGTYATYRTSEATRT